MNSSVGTIFIYLEKEGSCLKSIYQNSVLPNQKIYLCSLLSLNLFCTVVCITFINILNKLLNNMAISGFRVTRMLLIEIVQELYIY